MKHIVAALAFSLLASTAYAQSPPASCKMQATDKKLAGAAQTSFMQRCQKDAQAACEKSATDKKLNGAARTSYTKKCVTDAVGS